MLTLVTAVFFRVQSLIYLAFIDGFHWRLFALNYSFSFLHSIGFGLRPLEVSTLYRLEGTFDVRHPADRRDLIDALDRILMQAQRQMKYGQDTGNQFIPWLEKKIEGKTSKEIIDMIKAAPRDLNYGPYDSERY